ncbi:MAG: response regulator [Bacteroidota bacterium]|nr:response regulator [Candidatus Kapabacteria bacterium]MCS7302877.1 response regulator [Candidatus Kapabacteria bacterium]MCX7936641.1 response regulator [Chlorobiota bacterium]MDW8075371.1 response regulator [Bacteroidota bacterium]
MTASIRHTVFIVDDVPQNIQVAATALRDNGYNVSFATSGAEALERIPLVMPDLILLDVMMPEMNGFQVCQALKRDARTSTIPIIFLTALNDSDSVVQAFSVGGVDYVTKPFNTAELLARVRTQCSLHTLQRLLAEKNTILEDLSRTLEAQVAQRTEALQAALRRQQNFGQMSVALVGLINHEFRTPMTVIQSSIDMLQYAERLESPKREELCATIKRRVTESIDAMQRHLDSVALMIEQHTTLLYEQPQLASPAQIVQEIAHTCASRFNRLSTLKIVIRDVPSRALLMVENFRAALSNIITNAFEYSPPDTTVQVTCNADESWLTVTVDDEGPGIDPEEEPYLYNWFKRGRAHTSLGKHRGLGVGLPLAQLAAETMMGSVWHERRFPHGSRFVLHVPYGQDLTCDSRKAVLSSRLSSAPVQAEQ